MYKLKLLLLVISGFLVQGVQAQAVQSDQKSAKINEYREEVNRILRGDSERINALNELLSKAIKLDDSEADKGEKSKLVTEISTSITKEMCDDIPSTLQLLNKTADDQTIIDELTTLLDVCANAYQVVKVEGVSSDREKYRKNLEKLKSIAQEYVRIKSYSDLSASENLDSFRKLTLFIKDFSETIDDVLEFNPVQLEIPPWTNKLFSFQFYAGAEAVSVNDFLQDTSVRVGFQAYQRFSRKIENWRSVTKRKCVLEYKCGTLSWPGLHSYVNASWTSVYNHTFVEPRSDEDQTDTDPTDTQDEIEEETIQALVTEFGIFLPFYTRITGDYTTDNYNEFMGGFIFNSRFSFTDDTEDKIATQYFGGFRLANNEETYLDLLVGKHEGIKGVRGEIRGQYPVSTFAGGRLFLGGRFNVGLDSNKELNEDAWQVYFQWQTSFDELWQQSN